MLLVKENIKGKKYEELEKLRESLNITIEGLENYPIDDRPIYLIANHSCLMDIFYLGIASLKDSVMIVSNRVAYKNTLDRKQVVDKYLYTLPLEPAHKSYSDITLSAAVKILCQGINLSIFPEGVYNDKKAITRGRTGAARILFETCKQGVMPHLIPVAIDAKTKDPNLNRYKVCEDDEIEVKILESIDYNYLLDEYLKCDNLNEKNIILHEVTDIGMKNIADALDVPFIKEYKEAIPKDNIMFEDGTTISLDDANLYKNINRFKNEIDTKTKKLIKVLKK